MICKVHIKKGFSTYYEYYAGGHIIVWLGKDWEGDVPAKIWYATKLKRAEYRKRAETLARLVYPV